MKLLVMIVMMSSLLFSWQKQIILGSYSVESNGKRALQTINKQIDEDAQLKGFIEDYKLRSINTVISDYTVVSVNAFESYKELLNTMLVLKRYYPDAYVLKYPTKNIANAENLQDIAAKALVEEKLENTQDAEEKAKLAAMLEEKVIQEVPVQEEVVQESAVVEEELSTPKEEIQEEVAQEEMIQAEPIKVIEPEAYEYANNNKLEEQSAQTQENILYIVLLALLALIAAGFTVFKIASNTKAKKQEENV
jgi:hypothetical protein